MGYVWVMVRPGIRSFFLEYLDTYESFQEFNEKKQIPNTNLWICR